MINKKILKIGVISIFTAILLSGCSAFEPLPDEERYKNIDKVLSDIDYKNIGKSRSETRDDNGGI